MEYTRSPGKSMLASRWRMKIDENEKKHTPSRNMRNVIPADVHTTGNRPHDHSTLLHNFTTNPEGAFLFLLLLYLVFYSFNCLHVCSCVPTFTREKRYTYFLDERRL